MTPPSAPRGAGREPKWIRFERDIPTQAAHKKTLRWDVQPTDGGQSIGYVAWYGPWRKYTFSPQPNTVFEQQCLRDIADFCERATTEHRASSRAALAAVGEHQT